MKHDLIKFFKSQFINIGLSRKFFLTLLAFIFGITVHSFTKFSSWNTQNKFLVLVTIVTSTVIVFLATKLLGTKLRKYIFWCWFGIIFLFGIIVYENSLAIHINDISELNGQRVTLRGLILEETDQRLDHQKIKVSRFLGNKFKGTVLVRTSLYPEFVYGDEIELTCYLQKPEAIKDFAYDEYLARFDIYSVCYQPENLVIISRDNGNWLMSQILLFKRKLSQDIDAVLPEPYASLSRGISLGERGTISREIQENFRRAGLSHILAISGFNITIVISLVGFLIQSIIKDKKVRFLIISMTIIFFVLMVGADASVVRAAIMGTLVILAKSNARFPPPRITLSLAGVIMLGVNPKFVAFDRGFLLSFAATVGIIYFSPLLQKYFRILKIFQGTNEYQDKIYGYFRELACSTFAAIIFTLPLTMYFFKNISLVALFVNLLVVPMIPIIMIASLLVGLVGSINVLSNLIAPALYASIYFVEYLSEFFARIPGASLGLTHVSWIIVPIFYGIIFYVALSIKTKLQRLDLLESFRKKSANRNSSSRLTIID